MKPVRRLTTTSTLMSAALRPTCSCVLVSVFVGSSATFMCRGRYSGVPLTSSPSSASVNLLILSPPGEKNALPRDLAPYHHSGPGTALRTANPSARAAGSKDGKVTSADLHLH